MSDYEATRSRVVALHLAAKASATVEVRRIRREVFGDEDATVSEDQARALLASPVARAFAPADFARRGIPIVGHRSRDERHGEVVGDNIAMPSGATWRIEWPGGTWSEPIAAPSTVTSGRTPEWTEVFLPAPGGRAAWAQVWTGSVVAELGEVSRWLASHFPWRPDSALWFVVTGEAPPIEPLTVEVEPAHDATPARIVVRAEPWVSVETVARAVRDAQRRLTGGTNRPMGGRLLAVFEFVDGHEQRRARPPWRELRKQWNATHPEWAYGDVRNLAGDYRRALRLLFPDSRISGSEGDDHRGKKGGPN